tara:strand:+ start:244 stop:528 length:285 start_codon:yes stop_codon:yes gene_type:complete
MKKIVDNIEGKVNKIISLYKSASDKNELLLSEKSQMKKLISEKDKEIKKLEEKIKLLRITKSVNSEESENIKESRKKINEYVREIDKCVALLNK